MRKFFQSLLVAGLFAFMASPLLIGQERPVGGGVTLVQVTNVVNALAGTNSSAGKLDGTNGSGQNITLYGPNDNPFSAPLTLWAFPGDIGSSCLNLYSSGAASGSIIHYRNDDNKGTDIGLWSAGFGQPYTAAFLIDLYDLNGLNTEPGPLFKISAAGQSVVVPDSGVSDHPFLIMNPTNGFVDFPAWKPDNRLGGPTLFHLDPLRGLQGLVSSSTNLFNGSGTVSASGRTVTGTSSKFLTEATIGSILYQVSSGNGGMVIAIASDTSLTVSDPISIVGGSSYSIQRPSISSRDGIYNSNLWVTANGNILSIGGGFGSTVEPLIWKDGSQTWSIGHGGGQMAIHNKTANTNPFLISDSAPDSSLAIVASGSLSLAQGYKALLASTNIGPLTVQGSLLPEAVGPTKVAVTDSGTNLVGATLAGGLSLSGTTLSDVNTTNAGNILFNNAANVLTTAGSLTGNGAGLTNVSHDIISGGSMSSLVQQASGASAYAPFGFWNVTTSSTINANKYRVNYNGYLTNFLVSVDTGMAVGTNCVYTIFTNGVASNMQISWIGAGNATAVAVSNVTSSVIIPAWTYLHINMSNNASGAPNNQLMNWSVEFVH